MISSLSIYLNLENNKVVGDAVDHGSILSITNYRNYYLSQTITLLNFINIQS